MNKLKELEAKINQEKVIYREVQLNVENQDLEEKEKRSLPESIRISNLDSGRENDDDMQRSVSQNIVKRPNAGEDKLVVKQN